MRRRRRRTGGFKETYSIRSSRQNASIEQLPDRNIILERRKPSAYKVAPRVSLFAMFYQQMIIVSLSVI